MPPSPQDATALVHQTLAAWARRDLDGTLRYMAPDIDFSVNVDPAVAPFAASARGIDQLRARLQTLLDTFHFDAFVPGELRVSPEQPGIVRINITYFYREKTTNYRLDGRFRLVIETREGQIVRVEELHDSHYIEAFVHLVRMLDERRDSGP